MKTKLNRKRLLGHRGQILAWLIVTFVALSLPLAPRAFADQYELVPDRHGVGRTPGLIMRIYDSKLDLRYARNLTMAIETTEKTQWFFRRLRVDHPEYLLWKMGVVKWRLGTGGSREAVEVRVD